MAPRKARSGQPTAKKQKVLPPAPAAPKVAASSAQKDVQSELRDVFALSPLKQPSRKDIIVDDSPEEKEAPTIIVDDRAACDEVPTSSSSQRDVRDVVLERFEQGVFDDAFKEAIGAATIGDEMLGALEGIAKTVHAKSEADQQQARENSSAVADKDLAPFEECVKTQRVDPRSPIGQRFAAQHKKGAPDGDRYRSIASRSDAAKFRVEWAQKQFQMRKDSKVFSQTWRRVDTTKGAFKTIDQIIDGQGKGAAAMIGSLRLIHKCVRMGGSWVKIHPQTERMLFLELSFSWREDFEVAYSLYQEEFNKAQPLDGSGASAAPAIADDPNGQAHSATDEEHITPRSTPKGRANAKRLT